ncbi:hypothetical protein NBRC3222_2696 [Acetobacter pasteurianus NBRC 3222]|nr:hypothetical protein NBRC3222_2696 [Acetobacter pasteurianus NBRC 3222]
MPPLTKYFEIASSPVPVMRTSILMLIINALRDAGIDPRELLARNGIDPDIAKESYSVVEMERYLNLFEEVSALEGNKALGFELGLTCTPGQIGPLGLLFQALPTLRKAVLAFGNYLFAVQSHSSLTLNSDNDIAEIIYSLDVPQHWPCQQDVELTLALLINLIRERLGSQWHPIQVDFMHAPGKKAAMIRRRIGCPIFYRQPHNRILFDEQDLDDRRTMTDPDLIRILERHVCDLIGEEYAAQPFISTVMLAIRRCILAGNPSLASVARALYTSPRTLQRLLARENTTFRSMLDASRKELANIFEQRDGLNRDTLAYRIGYSDGSSLSRSRKRWKK